jgi:hypothetical protein
VNFTGVHNQDNHQVPVGFAPDAPLQNLQINPKIMVVKYYHQATDEQGEYQSLKDLTPPTN